MSDFRQQSAHSNQSGIIAIVTVLIISAAALVIAFSISLLSIGELQLGFASQQGGEAHSVADGCMEEAMRRLRLDTGYASTHLTTARGSCIITIVPSGSNRTLTVTASTSNNFNKKIEMSVTLSSDTRSTITVNSWTEKDD
ncbi:MAG: hypothetical protein O2794_01775 [bacterium]|nr:hypothetical protein [bacterium]